MRMFIVLILVVLVALTGCASINTAVVWPVMTYSYVCRPMMPSQPFCLNQLDTESGFEYQGEFEACRQSVKNFVDALDHWYACRTENLIQITESIYEETTDTLQCMKKSFIDNTDKLISIPSSCLGVKTAFSDGGFYDSELDAPPMCVRLQVAMSRFAWKIDSCQSEVKRYLEGLQNEIEAVINRLRYDAQNAADEALKTFNCMARREYLCI